MYKPHAGYPFLEFEHLVDVVMDLISTNHKFEVVQHGPASKAAIACRATVTGEKTGLVKSIMGGGDVKSLTSFDFLRSHRVTKRKGSIVTDSMMTRD